MATTLVIMRHAKAQTGADDQADFDRELTEAGMRSLRASLPAMLSPIAHGKARVAIMSSPAARALQTSELLQDAIKALGLGKPAIICCDALWEQDAAAFLEQVDAQEADIVFGVGHNPFVQDLTRVLSGAALPCYPGAIAAVELARDPANTDELDRLIWFSQGPRWQHWKTLVSLEKTLSSCADTVTERLEAFKNDPDDIETMHKFRVSIRTLRSLVAFVKPWQDAEQNKELQSQLKSLVTQTSRLRELDVFAQLADESPASSEVLSHFCHEQAVAERAHVLAFLDSKPAAKALARSCKLAHSIKWKRPVNQSGLPATQVREHFDAMIEQLSDDLDQLRLSDEELTHDVRKMAKRGRYVSENFKDIVGEDALGLAKQMTAHQDKLGAICDARVNIALINQFLDQELPDEVAWDLTLLRAQNETFLYTNLRAAQEQPAAPLPE